MWLVLLATPGRRQGSDTVNGKNPAHGVPENCFFIRRFKNFSGTPCGAGFFPSTVLMKYTPSNTHLDANFNQPRMYKWTIGQVRGVFCLYLQMAIFHEIINIAKQSLKKYIQQNIVH